MSTTMHRLQISLPEWQYRYLQGRAERLGESIAGVIRTLVEKDAQARRRPIAEDPFWEIIGMVEGGDPDAGVEHDRYIYGLGQSGQSGGFRDRMTKIPDAEFIDQISGEFLLRIEKLASLIKHNLYRGIVTESILRNFLSKYACNPYEVGQGFVQTSDGKSTSKQCDIILYNKSNRGDVLFCEGDFVVVSPSAVEAVVEVKTNLRKDSLWKAIENIKSVTQLDERIYGFVFAFGYQREKQGTWTRYIQSYPNYVPMNQAPQCIVMLPKSAMCPGVLVQRMLLSPQQKCYNFWTEEAPAQCLAEFLRQFFGVLTLATPFDNACLGRQPGQVNGTPFTIGGSYEQTASVTGFRL